MAGTKERIIKSASAGIKDDKVSTTKVKQELRSWSDLPLELLEMILSHLTLIGNVQFSAVCKRWNSIAVSVRQVNEPPWIMYFPTCWKNVCRFFDPLNRKTYSIQLPKLEESRVCYTKGGWLLLYKSRTNRLFFFNPFTQDVIKLPKLEIFCEIGVAFSCDPKSPSCIVFTSKYISPTVIAISTCNPGSTEWSTSNYQNRLNFVESIWNDIVFSDGKFYCLSQSEWLGVFDPNKLTWNVLVVPSPACLKNFFSKNELECKFLVEHKGDIFVIYTRSCSNYLLIFKLDKKNKEWELVENLDGITLFASFFSSQSRSNLPMRNSVYFPKVRFHGKKCISYSLKDDRYYPSKKFNGWETWDPFESIWIDPPKDLSVFT